MERKNITMISAVVTLAVAVAGFNSYISPTGAAVTSPSTGSLTVAGITLIIAITLFAKYFGLIN